MKLRNLPQSWEETAAEPRSPKRYDIRLPIHDAAKLAALAEMYPGRLAEDLITDILSAALDDLEAAFPYERGSRVIAEDEEGDPIYADAGRTPLFQRLTAQHLARLRGEEA